MNITKSKFFSCLLIVISSLLIWNCGNKASKEAKTNPIESPNKIQSQGELSQNFFKIDNPKPQTEVKGRITVKGRHNIPVNSHVWILLNDGFGYYLQTPPVTLFQNKTWKQGNSNLNGGIKSIMAVSVGDSGHGKFNEMVASSEFGQFTDLPEDLNPLDEVEIVNPK